MKLSCNRRSKQFRHPRYQTLEQFVLGRLGPPDAPEAARVEEHLLICPRCRNVAEGAVEFAQAMREALSLVNTSVA